MTFYKAVSERNVSQDATGNVGIGTDYPAHQLYVGEGGECDIVPYFLSLEDFIRKYLDP